MMTSRAVGLYSPVLTAGAAVAAGVLVRFPRARPEPRTEPKAPVGWEAPKAPVSAKVAGAWPSVFDGAAPGAKSAPDVF